MPVVKPISDLQRNLGSIARTCRDSREPVYLTKNGSASLVPMDAEEFDRRQRALRRQRARGAGAAGDNARLRRHAERSHAPLGPSQAGRGSH